jgi:protein SCO1/2
MKTKIVFAIVCAVTATAVLSLVALHHHRLPQAVQPTTKTFTVLGQIRSVDIVNRIVRVAHEEIPDYMPAMTMPLSVKDSSLLDGLVPGDRVRFQLVVTSDDSWIGWMDKVPAAPQPETLPNQSTSSSLQELETERVQAGELVPDFTLVDQDHRPVHLSDFRGKAVLLTFIYTRCPLPNFCPLTSKNFSELESRLGAEFANRFKLLSVSIDPEFDQPEVLRAYASRYDARPEDWTFAGGTAEQIKVVADLMGLYYARENGAISHDVRTALIGPDGRLVHLWKSNVWTVYEVQRRVREILTGTKDVAAR